MLQHLQQQQQQSAGSSYKQNANDDSTSDRLRAQQSQQQVQQSQQMLAAASNLDSAGASHTDLLSQSSAPGTSSTLFKTDGSGNVGAEHSAHQHAGNIDNFGQMPPANHQSGESAQQTTSGANAHRQNNGAEQGNQHLNSAGPQTLDAFQYHQRQHRQQQQSNSMLAPRHLLLGQQQQQPNGGETPQALGSTPQFDTFGLAASDVSSQNMFQGSQQMDGQQLMLAVQQQQQLQQMNQQQQQPQTGGKTSALLNQLTRLWSIVGRQKSLLPSMAMPFKSQGATMYQPQQQLQVQSQQQLVPSSSVQLTSGQSIATT